MPDRPHDDARTLFCVDDGVPEETTRVLREACERRGFGYEEVQAHDFDFSAASGPLSRPSELASSGDSFTRS